MEYFSIIFLISKDLNEALSVSKSFETPPVSSTSSENFVELSVEHVFISFDQTHFEWLSIPTLLSKSFVLLGLYSTSVSSLSLTRLA